MKKDDLIYLCKSLGDLTGVPVRFFHAHREVFSHALVLLPRDPMILYQEQILSIREHIGYFITPFFSYYGILNSGDDTIVIGPTRQVSMNRSELKELAFRLDLSAEEINDFIFAMESIVCFPLDSLMQVLCTINFALNHEKRSLSDIVIVDAEQENLHRQITTQYSNEELNVNPSNTYQKAEESATYSHTAYHIEKQLMGIITKGDTKRLHGWLENAPAVRSGILSTSQLRQYKNIFIVTATLASRAAISGGLSEETAFRLSDAYIQKCELLNDASLISNLEYHMIMDYTERVERIRIGEHPSALTLQVANYVNQHIYDPISIDHIASSLFLSKSRLFARFKAESGMTLYDFVLQEKTEEAKRLLRFTDKSATSIGILLGFSSQSHFTRVFKKYTGMTPGEYRDH